MRMSFELCNPPGYLRISDPSRTLESQIDNFTEHLAYWITAYQRSVSEVDLGLHVINNTFFDKFNEALAFETEQFGPDPVTALEAIRQRTVDLLAISGLARKIVAHPEISPKDARTHQKGPQILIDTYGIPSRFHMVHEACDLILPQSSNTTQWYRDGDLFVKRTTPAEFSMDQDFALSYVGMQADPTTMATLYPYLGNE